MICVSNHSSVRMIGWHPKVLSLIVFASSAQAVWYTCPKDFNQYLNIAKCVKVFPNPMPFADAEKFCVSLGRNGHLGSADRKMTRDYIGEQSESAGLLGFIPMWVGLHLPDTLPPNESTKCSQPVSTECNAMLRARWKTFGQWTDGTNFTLEVWNNNTDGMQPNELAVRNPPGKCAALWANSTAHYPGLGIIDCDTPLPFICFTDYVAHDEEKTPPTLIYLTTTTTTSIPTTTTAQSLSLSSSLTTTAANKTSADTFAQTSSPPTSGNSKVGMVAGIVIGCLAFILLAAVTLFIFLRKRTNQPINLHPPAEVLDTEEPITVMTASIGGEPRSQKWAAKQPDGGLDQPISSLPINTEYPHTTIDPIVKKNELARSLRFRETIRRRDGRIPRHTVIKLTVLGEGAFGTVYQGILRDGQDMCPVAIKEMKPSATLIDTSTFLAEANLMKTLVHPNIVTCIGVMEGSPLCIVIELMPLGSLVDYLRISKAKGLSISLSHRLHSALQIANGMAYLARRGVVHRDLAARNCMLAPTNDAFGYPVVKVADFGLSRKLQGTEGEGEGGYYRMDGGGVLPVAWVSPEAVRLRKFTTASDVWSYGVTMWEIFSDGAQPYPDLSLFTLISDLEAGYRLSTPEHSNQETYDLMRQCWALEPTHRPNFPQLATRLAEMFAVTSTLPAIIVQEADCVMVRPGPGVDELGYLDTSEVEGPRNVDGYLEVDGSPPGSPLYTDVTRAGALQEAQPTNPEQEEVA